MAHRDMRVIRNKVVGFLERTASAAKLGTQQVILVPHPFWLNIIARHNELIGRNTQCFGK